MNIEDLDGRICIEQEEDMLDRLRSIRRGPYGASILSHEDDGPSLWIHINCDVAYLHYFPNNLGQHPGFQSADMYSTKSVESVHFLQTSGDEGDSFMMTQEAVVAVDKAYRAAVEFFHQHAPPISITWAEL